MRNLSKGITLISLVITIIVLLILAGITINLTIGQNGIMNMAQLAGKNHIDAEQQEKNDLEDLYSSMMVATNDDSKVTISMEDLNSLIQKSRIGQSVSSESYERIQTELDLTIPVGTTYLSPRTTKFGTIDDEGYLTFNEPGLYYVSSNLTLSYTTGGQVYNAIYLNDEYMTYSFVNRLQASAPASVTFYANAGDKLRPCLTVYGAESKMRVWWVGIYKIY